MQLNTIFAAALCTLFSLAAAHDEAANSRRGYTLTDDLTYDKFFDAFNFYTGPDPTKGFVQFQNLTSAIDKGLVGYLDDTKSVFMGVDYKSKDPNGRDAIRIESKKAFSQGLVIADIYHMPPSECGVWPAFWMLGSNETGQYNWPNEGEIDILEGVNDHENNAVTLHTSTGCTIDNATQFASDSNTSPSFTGSLATSDCDVKAQGQPTNKGCSIQAPASLSSVQMGTGDSSSTAFPSYGTNFNAAGGGVYAMEWTATSISVWFIPRSSPLYATHFSANATSSPDPSQWGTPIALFSGSGCDYTERFRNLKLIFNITFCGEWAGAEKEWSKSCKAKTGAATCMDYVRDNPEAFEQAYWEVAALKVYEHSGKVEKRGVDGKAFVRKSRGRYQRA